MFKPHLPRWGVTESDLAGADVVCSVADCFRASDGFEAVMVSAPANADPKNHLSRSCSTSHCTANTCTSPDSPMTGTSTSTSREGISRLVPAPWLRLRGLMSASPEQGSSGVNLGFVGSVCGYHRRADPAAPNV